MCNYVPAKIENNTLTAPFELAHKTKPDLCALFKLFSDTKVLKKFEAQSIPMIAIGQCPNSNGIQFYNPANGAFESSIDYKFQPNTTSEAHFGVKYQSGTFMYRLDEAMSVFAPKFTLESSVYVCPHSPPSVATTVGIPTYDNHHIYTVAFKDGLISEYTNDILSLVPETTSSSINTPLPYWAKGVQMQHCFFITCLN